MIVLLIMFVIPFLIKMLIIAIPAYFCKKNTLIYCNTHEKYNSAIISGLITILLTMITSYMIISEDSSGLFHSHYSGETNISLTFIFIISMFCIFILPVLFRFKRLSNVRKQLNIKDNFTKVFSIIFVCIICIFSSLFCLNKVKVHKIKVTDGNKYKYSDFIKELNSRNLYPKKNSEKINISRGDISTLDSSSEYLQSFSSTTDFSNPYFLSPESDNKFPFFLFESYVSFIERNPKTADYYEIGYDDSYIEWNIYYINGKIYAAISSISYLGKRDLGESPSDLLVLTEENDIIVYNRRKNYYLKGGCFLDTESGTQRSPIPKFSEFQNPLCMKTKVVDKIDSSTLDSIAKEIYPSLEKKYNK